MEITSDFEVLTPRSAKLSKTWFSWTVRGLCLVILFGYLLLGPVHNDYDIIATVIVCCLGAIFLLGGTGTAVLGVLNAQQLSVSHGIPDSFPVFAGGEILLSFHLQNLRLFPFFNLGLRIEFESEDLPPLTATVRASGATDSSSIYLPVTFPHRGNWRFKKVIWEVFDSLELWHFRRTEYFDEVQAVLPVSPPLGFDSPPPIINSCLRDGDAISDIQEPRGDYYDLKAYHPSDGVRKIVWKMYARSGELLSRHPEKTMTPEGKVLLFVCAKTLHDNAARLALNYFHYVSDADLECSAVCLGQGESRPFRTVETFEKALIEYAWKADTASEEAIETLLNTLTAQDRSSGHDTIISHVVIVADLTVAVPGYEDFLISVGKAVEKRELTPVFLVTMPFPQSFLNKNQPKLTQTLTRLLFELPSSQAVKPNSDHFINLLGIHKWEHYRVFP